MWSRRRNSNDLVMGESSKNSRTLELDVAIIIFWYEGIYRYIHNVCTNFKVIRYLNNLINDYYYMGGGRNFKDNPGNCLKTELYHVQ